MKDRDVLLTYLKDKQGIDYTGKIYYNGELIDVPAGWKIRRKMFLQQEIKIGILFQKQRNKDLILREVLNFRF